MYGALPFPVGYVFVTDEEKSDACRNKWSLTLSHEILELIANPHVNLMVCGPDPAAPKNEVMKPANVFFSREVCDPVKDSFYCLDEVTVANFVLPLYFLPNGHRDERVDFLGACDGKGEPLKSFG